MKSPKLCRTSLIRLLIAVALISSLLTLPALGQDTEDSQIFISGFNAYQQQNYSVAIDRMNEVLRKYPNSSLRDMSLFWLARAHFKSGHRQDAARIMSQFTHEYPDNPLKGTVEEELLALAAAYDKGEKIPTAPPTAATPSPKKQEQVAAGKTSAQAEAARLAAAQKEQERIAAQQAEKARAAAEAAETARLVALKAEKERAAAAERARQETARKERERIAAVRAEELRLKKQREAEEKALAAKSQLREKAIAQYQAVIQTYPNTNAAKIATAKLRELGITVAQQSASGRQSGETGDNSQVLQLEVAQFAGFEFRLLSSPVADAAGRTISLPFEVTNRGNGSDSFRLESGFPAEFQAGFAPAGKPDHAISETPSLAPNETFQGIVNLTIPAASIDGLSFSHPIKASSAFMPEATQSREIRIAAAAPFLRAVLKTDQIRPLPGDRLTYRLVVLNVGSTTARDVTVRLSYPPQLEPLAADTAGFAPDAKSALLLKGLQVKSGERKEYTVAFQLKDDSLAGQDLALRAELTEVPLKKSSAFISNLANVEARHGIRVRAGSEKLVIIPGETVNAPFTVSNTGNTRDTFTIAATVTGSGTATIFHDLNRDGLRQANEPAITEIGPLEPREEAAVIAEIRTSREAADGSQGGIRLDFSPKGAATTLEAGSVRLIYSRPILQMSLSKSDGRLRPGEIASYDLTVVNRGSNLARVVELQSSWPEQLELVAAEPANSSAEAGTIHWKFKELGAGEKRSIKVSFRVKPGIGAGTSIQVRNSLNYEDLQGNRY